jgi:hypothetical protein
MKKRTIQKLALKKTTLSNLGNSESQVLLGGALSNPCLTIYTMKISCTCSVKVACFSELDCTTPGICPVLQ